MILSASLLAAWAAFAAAEPPREDDLGAAFERASRLRVGEMRSPTRAPFGMPSFAMNPGDSFLPENLRVEWFEDLERAVKKHLQVLEKPLRIEDEPARTEGEPEPPIAAVSLKELHNKLLKTSVTRTLGGRQAWLSGLFSRDKTAYVSLLVEGQGQFIYNPRHLLSAKSFKIGEEEHRIWVAPSIWNKWRSDIVIDPKKGAQWRVMARDMYKAYMETAVTVTVGGRTYRLLYFDAVNADSKMDAGQKTLVFVHTDKEGLPNGLYLIPKETVPAAGRGEYALHEGQKVWLNAEEERLNIYDAPK